MHTYICVYIYTYIHVCVYIWCTCVYIYVCIHMVSIHTMCICILIHVYIHTYMYTYCEFTYYMYVYTYGVHMYTCVYDIFGKETTNYTVTYGAFIRLWPTLPIANKCSKVLYEPCVHVCCHDSVLPLLAWLQDFCKQGAFEAIFVQPSIFRSILQTCTQILLLAAWNESPLFFKQGQPSL